MVNKTDSSNLASAPPLKLSVRFRLSAMVFLEFAVFGAWSAVLGNYLDALRFSGDWIGWVNSTVPLGAMISPVFVGWLADRHLASRGLMATLHLMGSGLLCWAAHVTEPLLFLVVMMAYALVYSPTLPLANSIVFTFVPEAQRDFPRIRVLGTVGWITANLIVGGCLSITTNQPLLLAAGFSLVLGLFSLLLPHRPPPGKAGDPVPFLRTLALLKDHSFTVFCVASFVISIALAFYISLTGIYLDKHAGVKDVASTLTIGQGAEMILLPFLPFFLRHLGMKWVLALGMLAWSVRYAIFAVGQPYALVIASLALHGVCFDFFFAAGFIHVDNAAPAHIRASAQSLFAFLTYGAGMFFGSILSGRVLAFYTDPNTHERDWACIWIIPTVGILLSLAVFVLFFSIRLKSEEASSTAPE